MSIDGRFRRVWSCSSCRDEQSQVPGDRLGWRQSSSSWWIGALWRWWEPATTSLSKCRGKCFRSSWYYSGKSLSWRWLLAAWMGSQLGSECSRRTHHLRMANHLGPWWSLAMWIGPFHRVVQRNSWLEDLYRGRWVPFKFASVPFQLFSINQL